MSPLTLGTAGHIDHGKTALVEALTGKNTDRLEEEHRRGISIELGYARLELPGGRSLSVIDVPGHERLDEVRLALADAAELADARRAVRQWEEPAVLHVDRVFALRGIGTVVTGTLWSGVIREGERVEVLPEGIELRVRSIQVHDAPV